MKRVSRQNKQWSHKFIAEFLHQEVLHKDPTQTQLHSMRLSIGQFQGVLRVERKKNNSR